MLQFAWLFLLASDFTSRHLKIQRRFKCVSTLALGERASERVERHGDECTFGEMMRRHCQGKSINMHEYLSSASTFFYPTFI